MLEEQLEAARQTESQRWTGHSFRLAFIGFFLLAVLLSVTYLWVPSESIEQESLVITQESVNEPDVSEFLRVDFKNALKIFESDIEPLIESSSFSLWNNKAKNRILSDKANAISLFSSGDYQEALVTLKKASDLSLSELEGMSNSFREALVEAEKHYKNDAYDLSKIAITEALGMRPSDLGAIALAKEIDTLPQVLELLDAVKVAQVENNLEKEIKNLRQVQKLAPNREGIQGRLSMLEIKLKEFNFSSHIKNGLKQVSGRKLKAARVSLTNAHNIFANRDELVLLRAEVQKLSKTLKVEMLLKKAENAVKQENWKMVLDLYVELNKVEPNNTVSIEKIALAKKILSLSAQVSSHVESAHRLSSKNVMVSAKSLINESAKYIGLSKDLELTVSKLDRLVSSYEKKVILMIESDGQTEILVRGVGRVGKVKEKHIQLRPGRYTFEGIRSGFKSKLVRLEIPPKSTSMTLRIICDERL